MKKIIICLSLNVFLISCAGVQTGIKFENISLKTHIIDNVPLNTIISNEIGDKLIVSGNGEEMEVEDKGNGVFEVPSQGLEIKFNDDKKSFKLNVQGQSFDFTRD